MKEDFICANLPLCEYFFNFDYISLDVAVPFSACITRNEWLQSPVVRATPRPLCHLNSKSVSGARDTKIVVSILHEPLMCIFTHGSRSCRLRLVLVCMDGWYNILSFGLWFTVTWYSSDWRRSQSLEYQSRIWYGGLFVCVSACLLRMRWCWI